MRKLEEESQKIRQTISNCNNCKENMLSRIQKLDNEIHSMQNCMLKARFNSYSNVIPDYREAIKNNENEIENIRNYYNCASLGCCDKHQELLKNNTHICNELHFYEKILNNSKIN